MLVLSRKAEQSLLVGDDIVITVLGVEGDRVKLGIQAPRSVSVLRKEVYEQVHSANTSAAVAQAPATLHSIAAVLRGRASTTPTPTPSSGEVSHV